MNGKQRAAKEALSYIREGMIVGLGSGSTAEAFIHLLGQEIRAGKFGSLRFVATSVQSENIARQYGMSITTLEECGVVDLTIDGADEIDPRLHLIKGLGGALVREKIIEQNSRRFICIADSSKLVQRLGTRCPLPVEVLPFAYQAHENFFHSLGGAPHLRRLEDGSLYVTDNGNYIYHLKFPEGIAAPAELDRKLRARAGVVGTGLFIAMADTALVGSDSDERVQIIRHR